MHTQLLRLSLELCRNCPQTGNQSKDQGHAKKSHKFVVIFISYFMKESYFSWYEYQVMQGPDPEPKKKLKNILLAASR